MHKNVPHIHLCRNLIRVSNLSAAVKGILIANKPARARKKTLLFLYYVFLRYQKVFHQQLHLISFDCNKVTNKIMYKSLFFSLFIFKMYTKTQFECNLKCPLTIDRIQKKHSPVRDIKVGVLYGAAMF